MRALQDAQAEWQQARAYFDWVTEPELVDHAVLLLAAAERRYGYLLRRVAARSPQPEAGCQAAGLRLALADALKERQSRGDRAEGRGMNGRGNTADGDESGG